LKKWKEADEKGEVTEGSPLPEPGSLVLGWQENQRGEGRARPAPQVKCPALVLDSRVPRVPLTVLQGHGPFQAEHVEAVTSLGYLGVLSQKELLQHLEAWRWDLVVLLVAMEQVVPRGSRGEVAETEDNTVLQPDVG
jgi:hypothetical protein